MITLAIVLAVFVGVSLGLIGGGGSILTVPLLAYVAGMEAKQAIATSLLVVGTTSVVGSISHARAGRVQWRTALLFGATAMAGAYGGGYLAKFIPGGALLIGFAVMMVATAFAMLRGRKNTAAGGDQSRRPPLLQIASVGLAVGTVTGLIGAGGGFLLVPALVLLGGLPMPIAVGTSLVIIAMNSFAGLLGYLSSVRIDWALGLALTAAAVVGALIGARFAGKINPETLRKGFGWFVLGMASLILGEEVHPAVGITGAALTVVAGAMTFACTHYAACPLRRLTRRSSPKAAAA
ncbi:sulfite exporter TauE/SafE family protein [Candidatus Mycolicibacterium alkanivorans]|uniref:Probable membrane transporter protein n=1 Tax=Candidatus Mycolicibacterium alkanivorans TaxID=2954114 RepID=A0ABS9YSP7_9MYCO|nr:sulfite exporter TauE/SafE family protein [Candidatus Mycolicibacterium alkanivorans]MCI4673897.1 sulfite exporter TauE/SafE family protein [Candidatus Mycolicibacterium alkanivorans]